MSEEIAFNSRQLLATFDARHALAELWFQGAESPDTGVVVDFPGVGTDLVSDSLARQVSYTDIGKSSQSHTVTNPTVVCSYGVTPPKLDAAFFCGQGASKMVKFICLFLANASFGIVPLCFAVIC